VLLVVAMRPCSLLSEQQIVDSSENHARMSDTPCSSSFSGAGSGAVKRSQKSRSSCALRVSESRAVKSGRRLRLSLTASSQSYSSLSARFLARKQGEALLA
jgi:hypothetical protein